MKKDQLLHALQNLRKISKKRKFTQTVDLIINLRDLDKKHNVDAYLVMPHNTGKGTKICAIVDGELEKDAKASADKVITKLELTKLTPKEISKIAKDYDIFIAQASLMGQIATVFGRILGPLGKMPNPKAGGVVMSGGSVKASVDRFKKNLRIKNKNELVVKVSLGKEDFEDSKLVENAMVVYEAVSHAVPNERNIKNVVLKMTMSKPVVVGKPVEVEEEDARKK